MTFLVCEYRSTWNFFLRDDDARIVAARLGLPSQEECLAAIESVKASMGASVVDAAAERAPAGESGPDGPTFTLFGTTNHWRYEFCNAAGQMLAGGDHCRTREALLGVVNRVQAAVEAEVEFVGSGGNGPR